ncbi:MAG: isoprenyl transferase [Deltaproteobacteria bacterium]
MPPRKTDIDPALIPSHIAIIMDGNGRWAKRRGLIRLMGHKAGIDSVRDVVEACNKLGVKVLTLYAFSTENWKRPTDEVNGLMELLRTFLQKELANMLRNNIRLKSIGQIERIPAAVREVLIDAIERTATNDGLVLNLALSYGSRNEITAAARRIATLAVEKKIEPANITEELFAAHLFTAGLPDPDLLIRTGGEYRLSNFLLWQLSYAELYVTDIAWPEFREKQLREAILSYQRRQRRFGRTGDQVEQSA